MAQADPRELKDCADPLQHICGGLAGVVIEGLGLGHASQGGGVTLQKLGCVRADNLSARV